MPGLDHSVYHFQNPDRPWQLKPPRACRAGIEQQRLAEPFNFRLMRMTKDAEVWLVFLEERSSILRQLPPFVQNMADGNAPACRCHNGLRWKSALFEPIDVAGDSRYGSDGSKLLDDVEPADIAGAER